MIKQINVKLRQETINELQALSNTLSNISETKVDQSKIVRYAIHELLKNQNELLRDINRAKSFNLIVQAYDITASMKAYEYTPGKVNEEMIKDLDQTDKEIKELYEDEEE